MCVCVCVCESDVRQTAVCVTLWHVAGRPQTSRRQRVLAEGGGAPGVPRPCACGQGTAGRQRQLPAATHRVSRALASASFVPCSGLGLLCRALASASFVPCFDLGLLCAVLWPRPPVPCSGLGLLCRAVASASFVPCSGLGLLCRAVASASCAVLWPRPPVPCSGLGLLCRAQSFESVSFNPRPVGLCHC